MNKLALSLILNCKITSKNQIISNSHCKPEREREHRKVVVFNPMKADSSKSEAFLGHRFRFLASLMDWFQPRSSSGTGASHVPSIL